MTGLGDPAARTLAVLLHPTPGASGFDPDPGASTNSGLHILTFDRPGYGATEPDAVTIVDWVDDLAGYLMSTEITAETATHTAYGQIGLIGWREGGIYATALASRHPDLVRRLVLMAVPTPARASAARHWIVGDRQSTGTSSAGFGDLPGYGERFARMLDSASLHGEKGAVADRRAFEAGLAHHDTQVDTLILYGAQDAYATVHDARWYADAMPNSHVERVAGDGNLIGPSWPRALQFIAM